MCFVSLKNSEPLGMGCDVQLLLISPVEVTVCELPVNDEPIFIHFYHFDWHTFLCLCFYDAYNTCTMYLVCGMFFARCTLQSLSTHMVKTSLLCRSIPRSSINLNDFLARIIVVLHERSPSLLICGGIYYKCHGIVLLSGRVRWTIGTLTICCLFGYYIWIICSDSGSLEKYGRRQAGHVIIFSNCRSRGDGISSYWVRWI